MDVNRPRTSSVDFSAMPDRGRADSAPIPNADPVARARESARISTPRPSAQERARVALAGQLRAELRQWNDDGPKSEWAARLSVEGQILQAFAKGQERLDLPSEYSDIQFPTNLRKDFGISIFVTPDEPRAQLPSPLPRVSIPEGSVLNQKVKVEAMIRQLPGFNGNNRDAIETSCTAILDFMEKEIAGPNEKLDLFFQLASRINLIHVDRLEFAGKIFREQLHPAATELDAQMNGTTTSVQESTLRRLFLAMDFPIDQHLEKRQEGKG